MQKAGYEIEVISTRAVPVEMYSFFSRTGALDVAKPIADAKAGDYVGLLVPGGAKSPAILAEDANVRAFVKEANRRGALMAAICRGSLLLAKSDIVKGKRMTGFNDADQYPDLVVGPHAEAAGATWVDAPVVTDGNLVTSLHPIMRRPSAARCSRFLRPADERMRGDRDGGNELARRRQELPWVRVDKEYRFETDEGSASLNDLFGGRSQLVVCHFMFGPDYKAGCPSCSAPGRRPSCTLRSSSRASAVRGIHASARSSGART